MTTDLDIPPSQAIMLEAERISLLDVTAHEFHPIAQARRLLLSSTLGLVLIVVSASCGSGDDSESTDTATADGEPAAAEDTGDGSEAPADSTSSTTTTTTTSPATSSTVLGGGAVALECSHSNAITELLWDATQGPDSVFAAFGSLDPPTGTMEITAFDPDANLLAGIWWFPEPLGDGLAQGIVWLDGEVVGDVYYLDGVAPRETGDIELLNTGQTLTLELSTNSAGQAVADQCWEGSKPPLIAFDVPLTIFGIGPIQPGMTLAEVRTAVGDATIAPAALDEFEFSGGLCFHVVVGDDGLRLQMSGLGPESSPDDATIGAVIVGYGGYSTPSGIALGTPQAGVEAALGSQLEISPHEYVDGWYLDFVPNDPAEQHLRLRFVITSGVVTEMRAGLAEWTSLVEGCA